MLYTKCIDDCPVSSVVQPPTSARLMDQSSVDVVPHPLSSAVVLIQFFHVEDPQLLRQLARDHSIPFDVYRQLMGNSEAPMEMTFMKSMKGAESSGRTIPVNHELQHHSYPSQPKSVPLPIGSRIELHATPMGAGIVEASMQIAEGLETFADVYRTYVQGNEH